MPPVGRRFARSPVVVLVVALLVVALLVVVVLLAAAAAGWFGGQHRTITGEPAPGSDEPPAVADVLGRLPALPGTAVVDGAVPTANAVPLGICSSADSEALIGAGSEQVVITSSVNGQENIAVVAIPTVDPAGTLAHPHPSIVTAGHRRDDRIAQACRVVGNMREPAGVVPARCEICHTAIQQAHPQATFMVDQHRPYPGARQVALEHRLVGDGEYLLARPALQEQALLGADPQAAGAVAHRNLPDAALPMQEVVAHLLGGGTHADDVAGATCHGGKGAAKRALWQDAAW